ncbi:MAG TPA: DUF1450 domain-containing protein [Bacillota bacterium]|nr:DUF1450 domain-containing protein [Bacillota bacterium]
MGIVVVEVCDGNVLATVDVEQIIESKYPEVAVLMSDCLTYCGLCRIRPYALVNGKRIVGKSIEECLNNIYKAIEKELAIYE